MALHDRLTLDHVNSFFSLEGDVKPIASAQITTGGMGIDNLAEYPPPEPPSARKKHGTTYSWQYIQEEENVARQASRLESLNVASHSSLHGLNSLEVLSTAAGDVQGVNALNSEDAEKLYSNYYRKEVQYDATMPIAPSREQILKVIGIYHCVIIQGPTGCGKTTQVPQYILDEHAKLGKYCNIIVTQPRKIAAISIAKRVCEERSWNLGGIIGYQVGMDNKTSSDTRISYVTTGVLLQKLVNKKRMDMYTHVILDEVHERDQDTDFALLVIKKLLRTNSRNVKVILMSATIDASIFANYFSLPGVEAPSIHEIHGQSKEVTVHYLEELSAVGIKVPPQEPDTPKIYEELYDLVVKLVFIFDNMEKAEQGVSGEFDYAPIRGSVLIFLPGYEEITTMRNKLKAAAISRKFSLLPLHSSITIEEQTSVFKPPTKGYRKVIMSTNIAESSITVPDIKYVIDFCLTKNIVCDRETNYVSLRLEWASKSNCTQRKGRAGRVDIGRAYRLVTKDFYEYNLPEFNTPELKRCPLDQTVLHTKQLNFGEPQALLALAIDPPALSDIENSILLLKEAGALAVTTNGVINPYDGDLTFIGHVMASLPLDVKISKLILLGYAFGCLDDCIIIAACLSLKSFLVKQFSQALDSYKSSLSWADGTFSDCLAYLNAYKMWKNFSVQGQFHRPGGFTEQNWSRTNFIQLKRVKEVDQLVDELKKRLHNININPRNINYHKASKNEEVLLLKLAIAGAFYPHYFYQSPVDEENILRETNNGDPLSTVVISGLPKNQGILYYNSLYEMLACCSSRMSIEFEERKAYVQFDRRVLDSSAENSISPAVYFAVKMRSIGKPLELQVFSKEDADKKMTQLKIIQQVHSDNHNVKRLASNRMTVERTHTFVKKAELPGANIEYFKIFISYVVNAGQFWARYSEQTTNSDLQLLERPDNFPLHHLMHVVVGMVVWAPFTENKSQRFSYYRATIEEILPDEQVMVFFIDYGNTSQLKISSLRAISRSEEDILNIPAIAFECQLSEVKPRAAHSTKFSWSAEATQWFKSRVSGKTFIGHIYSVLQDVVRLRIVPTLPDGTPDMSLNEELKLLRFAEPAEESFLSKQNFEERARQRTQATLLRPTMKDNAMHFTPEDLRVSSDVKKSHSKVRLRGPYSPLEVSYFGITYLDQAKAVRIDRDSVNSVSLNAEPQDRHSQLLIASSISLGYQSNALTARSTTLMPKIKGLKSLLCLLFAPCAEYRSDPGRTCHTGAICGLGFDPLTGESLYHEHDIELAFDCGMDYLDLRLINHIRMGLDVFLNPYDKTVDINSRMVDSVQVKMRKNLIQLMTRSRPTIVPHVFQKKYKWLQVPKNYVLKSTSSDSVKISVFPMHPCINLSESNSYSAEIKRRNDHLHSITNNSTQREELECWICCFVATCRKQMKEHLESAEHCESEETSELK